MPERGGPTARMRTRHPARVGGTIDAMNPDTCTEEEAVAALDTFRTRFGWNLPVPGPAAPSPAAAPNLDSFAAMAVYDWVRTSGVDGVNGHDDGLECCRCADCADGFLHAPDQATLEGNSQDDYDTPVDGRTLCGRSCRLTIPGVFSRMGAPRCPACCAAAGLPPGAGSPKNDPLLRRLVGLA